MGCWTSVRGMRKGWLAAIFYIIQSSRRSASTLAIIRRPLIHAAGMSDPARPGDVSTEIKLRAGQSAGSI